MPGLDVAFARLELRGLARSLKWLLGDGGTTRVVPVSSGAVEAVLLSGRVGSNQRQLAVCLLTGRLDVCLLACWLLPSLVLNSCPAVVGNHLGAKVYISAGIIMVREKTGCTHSYLGNNGWSGS